VFGEHLRQISAALRCSSKSSRTPICHHLVPLGSGLKQQLSRRHFVLVHSQPRGLTSDSRPIFALTHRTTIKVFLAISFPGGDAKVCATYFAHFDRASHFPEQMTAPPHPFGITICEIEALNSRALRTKQKSSGKRTRSGPARRCGEQFVGRRTRFHEVLPQSRFIPPNL